MLIDKMNPLKVYMLIQIVLLSSAHSQVFNGTCEKFDEITKQAYVDWPFRVDCDNLRNIWELRPEKTDQDIFECNLTYNGSVIEEGIQELTSDDNNTFYIAELIINGSICLSNDIRVEFQSFPENCEQSINQGIADGDVIFLSNTAGDSVDLQCIPPNGAPDVIPVGSDKSRFYTRWYVNCKNDEYRDTNNLWREVDNPPYPPTLSMPTVDFWDAANFTCTVTYNRKILFVRTYAQCIKQQVGQTKPTITCRKEETAAPGDTAEFSCTGQIIYGITSSEDLLITWKKDGKNICENQFFNKTAPGLDDRQSCLAKSNNDSLVCISDLASKAKPEIQKGRKSVDLTLTLNNVRSSDYGNYGIVLEFRDGKTGVWQSDTWSMKLTEDKTPFYEKLIIAFATTFAVILPAIVLYFVYRYFKIYILLLYKRSSLRKYDKDDKDYVAYLSYFYNSEMASEENLEATKKIIPIIHKLLDDSNYNYYDEQIQSDFSVQVEQMTNMVEKCHRMIFVLSPEYLQDNWRRFHAELGFHGLMRSNMGLLFILLPNVNKLLKKSSRDDKVWKDLQKAMKVNPVIKFKHNMSDEKLRDSIDCYLPKLLREKHELNINQDGKPEYLRYLSQNTTCTEIA